MNDLKIAFSHLRKNPGFTVHPPQCCYRGRAVAVVTPALGIWADTSCSEGVTKP